MSLIDLPDELIRYICYVGKFGFPEYVALLCTCTRLGIVRYDTPHECMMHLSTTKRDKYSHLPYVDTNNLSIMWLKKIHIMISEESLPTLSPHVLHVGIYGRLSYVPPHIKTINLCNDICIESLQSIEEITAVYIRVANCPSLRSVECSGGIVVGCNNLTRLVIYQHNNTISPEEGDRIIVDTNDHSLYSATPQTDKICLLDVECDQGNLVFSGDASKIKHLTCNHASYKTLKTMGLGSLDYYRIQSDWLVEDIIDVKTLEYDLFRTERVFIYNIENLIVNIEDLEDGTYYPIACTTIKTLKIKAEYSHIDNSIPDVYIYIETLPNIKHMELNDCCIMLHSQPTLESLKLKMFKLDNRMEVSPTFENLTTLHTINTDYETIKSLVAPKLEIININWTDNRYTHDEAMNIVLDIASSFPMLKHIKVGPPYSTFVDL